MISDGHYELRSRWWPPGLPPPPYLASILGNIIIGTEFTLVHVDFRVLVMEGVVQSCSGHGGPHTMAQVTITITAVGITMAILTSGPHSFIAVSLFARWESMPGRMVISSIQLVVVAIGGGEGDGDGDGEEGDGEEILASEERLQVRRPLMEA